MEWTTCLVAKSVKGALKGGSYRSSAPLFDANAAVLRTPGNLALRREYIGFRLAQDAVR